MSKLFCAWSLLPLCLCTMLLAQAQSPAKTEGSKRDYSREAFVIEQSSRRIKFENGGTSSREDTGRVRIQSDAGVQSYGLLTFSYASAMGSFDIDYVRVRKPDGTVVVTPLEAVQDMAAQITREAPFYSDLHEKHVAVKGLGVGDVLEFETHEHITKPLAAGQFWLEYSFAKGSISLQEQLEVSFPRDRAVRIKSPKVKPAITDAGPYRVYTWTTANLEPQDSEKEKGEQTRLAWEQARGRFPQPDVQISSFQTWEDVGRWYGSLQAERIKTTPEIQTKAAELTKGAPDEEAKLRAIYKYVSTQFRYIGVAFGIGRYQPHSASEVLDNQYGDCKDKHTLLASLLNAAGIKAYPALISTVREIDADVPSPGQFDHVITVVPRKGGLVWLDTTTEVGPFEYLISPLRDKHALVIPEDNPATLMPTPVDFPFQSTQTFRMSAKLNDAGTLQGKTEFEVRGDLEYVLRSAFRRVPLPQWKELTQRISFSLGFGGEVSEVTASPPDQTDEPFHLTYEYTRKDFGDWQNRRIVAPAPMITLPTLDREDAVPSVPLWLGSPTEIALHAKIELPSSYRPELPAAIHLRRDFAEYDATYEFTNGALISERRLRLLAREVLSAQYAEFKEFRKAIADDYDAFIPLTSTAASSPSVAPAISAVASFQRSIRDLPDSKEHESLRLEGEARDAVSRKDPQSAISSLYRAVALDPKFARAWIMLGGLLMSSHQFDAGLDAFHKATVANPKEPLIYKAFGYFLMAGAKFQEAVPVWQDFIKVAPEDVDGPANLGSALFQLKRYSEAASALESAVKLHPERSSLQRQLASAYLRADNDEKAVAMFQKVFDLDHGTDTLNDVAYEMAEADKQLPLALQWAEKAVRAEEEASQKINLPALQIEDLDHHLKLAAYWDTLGWVQARMSKLDQAEKYLNAAWRLSQDGVAAAHLCQVYERLHKTQAAVHMCRLALYRLPLTRAPEMARAAAQMEEARSRLEHLSPGSTRSQNPASSTDELFRMHSFKLARLVPGTASAEFFVLLASDANTPEFKVQDLKFISGAEKLKSYGKVLTSIDFKVSAPDNVPARFVRRGIFGCYQYTGCSFVLLDPTPRSLN